MKEQVKKHIFRLFFGATLLYGLYALSVIYSCPTKLLAVEPGSPVIAYAAELKEYDQGRIPYPCDLSQPGLNGFEYRACATKREAFHRIAPDGTAELELQRAPFTHTLQGCHELWIKFKDGRRRRVIKLLEGNPGSGLYFYWGWAADSKAVFVYGQTDGVNCRNERRHLTAVYMVADKKLWDVKLQ